MDRIIEGSSKVDGPYRIKWKMDCFSTVSDSITDNCPAQKGTCKSLQRLLDVLIDTSNMEDTTIPNREHTSWHSQEEDKLQKITSDYFS